jgi:NTP pyrophosphatase (non-canonical NTP hydrolase)
MMLKPCPFCQSKNIAIGYVGQPATAFHVSCYDCGAVGPSSGTTGQTGSGSFGVYGVQEAVNEAIRKWGVRGDVSLADQMFDIDAYGEFVDEMWFPSKDGLTERDFRIMELGLPGEVGEVLELLKKQVRDGNLDKTALKKELGDVVYYWARICSAQGFTPSEVIMANVEKIEGRNQRGTLKGSGNDR